MGRVLKAVLALFAVIVAGVLGILALAQYRLTHARFTEELAVVVAAPGVSVNEAESSIAEPLEQSLSQVKGLESLRTTVTSGLVVINARITAVGMDAEPPVQLANEAVTRTLRTLPPSIDPPYVRRLEQHPNIRRFVATSERMSRLELSRWLDEVFRRGLEVQSGVREITFCGALEPELKVTLDQERLRAVALPADEVVTALQRAGLTLPGGRIDGSQVALRIDSARLADLQSMELRGPELRLRDVATLELTGEWGDCSTTGDILVSVHLMQEGELTFPNHLDVKLTPFTPKRVAVFMSPPGSSVNEALGLLARAHPGAVVTAERDELTLYFSEENPQLAEVPGLAVRSMDDHHALVQVSGPEFEQLVTLAGKARAILAKEPAKWLGVLWPGMSPEQVIKPVPGVKGLAQALQLAIGGITTGRLEDGTRIRVRTPGGLDEARLADGRPVSSVIEISQTFTPAAMLRINRQRTVELEVGLQPDAARKLLQNLELPPGYTLVVSADDT